MAGREIDERISTHRRVSAALSGHDDARLAALLATSANVTSIGGSSTTLDIEGTPVFVKRLALTNRELEPDAVGSTGNLFGLPARCHYGVGSPGFSARREVAATTMTSQWVLAGHTEQFPLLHHWRILPGAPAPSSDLTEIDRTVAHWGGDPAVRARLHALTSASTSLVMFLEHHPHTLSRWLAEQVHLGRHTAEAAAALLEAELLAGADTMAARGLIHFDTHFDNILTDGRRLYFADLGLAICTDFDLAPDETSFARRHHSHDHAYLIARLVNWLVTTFADATHVTSPATRNDYIRRCAALGRTPGLPTAHARTVQKYAPVAAVFNDFYANLLTDDRNTPYPAEAIDAALQRARRGI